MNKLFLGFLVFFFSINGYAQHTPFYSQYLFNPQAINPANAGFSEVLDVSLVHRRQWLGLVGAPQSTELNVHTALKNKKMNLGARIQNDQYGVTSNNSLALIYAYRVFFSKSRQLSFGADAGLGQIRNDWSLINTSTGGDPIYTGNLEKSTFVKFDFGVAFRDSLYTVGISIPDIFKSEKSGVIHDRQYLFFAEYRLKINKQLTFNPSFLIKHAKNSPWSFDINALATYNNKYSLGLGYRVEDAFLMLFRAKLNYQFEIGYSYDLTISPIKTFSSDTHEILLRYIFAYPVNATRARN